jgi:hypothetical protein
MLVKSAELIGWALGGLEREIVATKARLSSLTTQAAALRKRMGAAPAARSGRKQRRTMSPEARKRISEMMTKRWAERRKATTK